MSHVLMIAYHFPPVGFSSGVHRTLKFSQYLPDQGWDPVMLTVKPFAYERVSGDQLKDISSDVQVVRAFTLDVARHLAIFGRYPGILALPDRWNSWLFSGVLSGLNIIRKYKPKVLWSTYPIATAHLIAFVLHRITGIPWVVDFRDSMTEANYPADSKKRKVFQWIEKKAVYNSSKVIFTTPGARRMYAQRYPDCPTDHWAIIENGYDEEKFIDIEKEFVNGNNALRDDDLIVLVHSGLLYPSERNPIPFFEAIADLKKKSVISSKSIKIILRASGHEDIFNRQLKKLDIEDIVTLAPPVNYGEALKEMLESDGLLLFQGAACNHQVPAKVYEYIRARKPVFAMTDKEGDTAAVLKEVGFSSIVPLDSSNEIQAGLRKFLLSVTEKNSFIPGEDVVDQYSRKYKTKQLSDIFYEIIEKYNG